MALLEAHDNHRVRAFRVEFDVSSSQCFVSRFVLCMVHGHAVDTGTGTV